MTDIFSHIIQQLIAANVDSPRLEARMLLAHILNCDPNNVPINPALSDNQEKQLKSLLNRRLTHEPLDKILGCKEFYKYRFIVDNNVLSPRPDSEILVEEAIKIAQQTNCDSILEFGVGSGCLILSILADVPFMHGLGLDKSLPALKIAAQNAINLKLNNRVEFRQFDYFTDSLNEKFSLIISNPPYIPTSDISNLDKEVREHDPLMALDGGTDGYAHYRQLAEVTKEVLLPQGYILLEGGAGQADNIVSIFINSGLHLIKKVCDLSGIERCIILQK